MKPAPRALAVLLTLALCAAPARALAAAAPGVADLPLTEVMATGPSGGSFALLITGDGGWAGLDQAVAGRLGAVGIPVVGLSTLKYFWKAQTPESTTADVARVLRHYLAQWNKTRVILIGYSFGGQVMPFIVNRLPADLRKRVATITLLAPGSFASFEFHASDWIPGRESGGLPVVPEIQRMERIPLLCLYGDGDTSTFCPDLPPALGKVFKIGSGHHFGWDSVGIVDRIIETARDAGR
jgi:type IV secretory pathway VirJ component